MILIKKRVSINRDSFFYLDSIFLLLENRNLIILLNRLIQGLPQNIF